MSHTPGPWRIIQPPEEKFRPYGVQMGKEGGFMVPCFTANQSKHNARLIATAPELLEALNDLLIASSPMAKEPQSISKAVKKALSAIAKAKGET